MRACIIKPKRKGCLMDSVFSNKETAHLMGGPADGEVLQTSAGVDNIIVPVMPKMEDFEPGVIELGYRLCCQAVYRRLAQSNIFYCKESES